MSLDLDPAALALLGAERLATLATLRQDGMPHLSVIAYGWDGEVARVSVTEDRVKVKHLRRDPRAALHVANTDRTSWVSVDGPAELSDVTTTPGDAAGQELAQLYEKLAGGPHPDWAEFHAAMVTERRLVLRLRPERGISGGAG